MEVKTYAIAAALLIDPDREGFFESFFSKIFKLNTKYHFSLLLVDPAPFAPFLCPINIATTITATNMIPIVPNVDASAAVEIP